MSAEAVAFTRSWKVGAYTATLSVPKLPDGGMGCALIEWSPAMPQRLSLSERTQYHAGRDAAIAAYVMHASGAVSPKGGA